LLCVTTALVLVLGQHELFTVPNKYRRTQITICTNQFTTKNCWSLYIYHQTGAHIVIMALLWTSCTQNTCNIHSDEYKSISSQLDAALIWGQGGELLKEKS
jgi:hypothetical protein